MSSWLLRVGCYQDRAGDRFWSRRRCCAGIDGWSRAALRLLGDWAFATFDELARLELWILPGNERSLRVAEKAGFQREGLLRTRHQFGSELRDVISYSRLRNDLG